MIHWTCRQCGEGMEAPESMAGGVIPCPQCGMGNTVPVSLCEAVESRANRPAQIQIVEAQERLELERIAHRPALRRALAQTAVGIAVWVLFSVALGLALAAVNLAQARGETHEGLTAAAALLSLASVLGLAWFIGGIVRALLALSRMI